MAAELVTRTLEYHCVQGEPQCHCDWRLTLQNCIESRPMTIIYYINIAISALVFLIGMCLVAHRVFIKGHLIFEIGNGKGCLRPKPIDSMLLLLSTYNLLRLLTSVILVTDIAEDMISRSFMFEFPWQFGYGSFALYLVGIAQTLADSHKAISTGWLPSARTVDIVGSTFFLAPFILNNVCVLVAGAYARSNLYVAEVLTRILYVLWFLHCFSLAMAVLFSGIRLVRILNRHLAKVQSSGPRYTSIKTGIFKIRAVMGCIVVCLILFAIFLLMYGILRDEIMINPPGSIFLGTIWNFLGPVTTLCVEIAVIFNPRIGSGSGFGFKSSSDGGKTGTNEETMSSSYAGAAGIDNSFQATSISHHAFEDLKQQQLQYQQVFQKHNNRHHPTNNSSTDLTANNNNANAHNHFHMDDLSKKTSIATISGGSSTKYPVWTNQHEPDFRVDDDFSSQIQLMNDR